MSNTMKIYHLDHSKKEEVLKQLKKLESKCSKLGVKPPHVTIGEKYTHIKETLCSFYTPGAEESSSMAGAQGLEYCIKTQYDAFDIIFNYEEIKMEGGWSLFAILTHETGSFIQVDQSALLPDHILEGSIKKGAYHCDHCNRKQRRNKSYIVKSKDEFTFKTTFKKVGSTCLKDFIGVDPKGYINAFKIYQSLRDFGSDNEELLCGGYKQGDKLVNVLFDTKELLNKAFRVINDHGEFVKALWEEVEDGHNWDGSPRYKNVRTNLGDATSDHVKAWFEILPSEREEREDHGKKVKAFLKWMAKQEPKFVEVEEWKENEEAVNSIYHGGTKGMRLKKQFKGHQWCKDNIKGYDPESVQHGLTYYRHWSQDPHGDNLDLRQECFGSMVMVKHYEGFDSWLKGSMEMVSSENIMSINISKLVGVVGFYLRQLEKEAQRLLNEAKNGKKSHTGEVGDRIKEVELTITRQYEGYGHFGEFYITTLENDNGDDLVYKGSKWLGGKEDKVTLTFTIKSHGEFNNIKQTNISRPIKITKED